MLGKLIFNPGMFILFLFVSFPPFITSHMMSFPSIFLTIVSIVPSLINIFVPICTSLYKFLYVIDTFVLFPKISSFVKVNTSPFSSTISSLANFPILISGPFVSNNNDIGLLTLFLTSFTLSILSCCSS